MIKLLHAASTLGLLFVATTSAAPAQLTADYAMTSSESEVRVVNNHLYRIRVILVDRTGRHHSLGRVAPSKAAIFTIEPDMIGSAPVQMKVFADEPVWSAGNTGEAIRSPNLYLRDGADVYVWVEHDLTRTEFTVAR
jgi:hypothetical protein